MIERAIDKLARRHGAHINEYDANNGADNVRRLTGKNQMPHIRDFTAGTDVSYVSRYGSLLAFNGSLPFNHTNRFFTQKDDSCLRVFFVFILLSNTVGYS